MQPAELFLTAIHTHAGPTLTLDQEQGQANNVAYIEPEPILLGRLLGQEVLHACRSIRQTIPVDQIAAAFVTLELPTKPREEGSGSRHSASSQAARCSAGYSRASWMRNSF